MATRTPEQQGNARSLARGQAPTKNDLRAVGFIPGATAPIESALAADRSSIPLPTQGRLEVRNSEESDLVRGDDGEGRKARLMVVIAGALIVGTAIWLVAAGSSAHPEPQRSITGGPIQAVTLGKERPCCTFEVKIADPRKWMRGHLGQTYTIHAIVIDAATGQQESPVEEAIYQPHVGQDGGVAIDEVEIDRPGNYVVRFILDAPNGAEIGQQERQFTVG